MPHVITYVARYPFSLTVHLKIGSQLFLDCAIHLNGEWEMCISQVCLPESQNTLFRDCFMIFNYDLQPKTPAKTEKDRLWNAKLRKLSLREKQRSIRITLPAGSYDNKAITEIINNTIQNDATIHLFREEMKFDLSTGKSVYLELPKIIDSYGRSAIQLQEEIINVHVSRIGLFTRIRYSPYKRRDFYNDSKHFKTRSLVVSSKTTQWWNFLLFFVL